MANCLLGLAAAAGSRGSVEQAARWCGTVHALLEALDVPVSASDLSEHDRHIAAIHDAMGPEAFAAAAEAGRLSSLDVVVGEALRWSDRMSPAD